MPFCLEFLKMLRTREAEDVMPYFKPGCRLLEIGGGTGHQAKIFSDAGFAVTSIDVPQSNYAQERIFPVIDYDGITLPVTDHTFDVVYSSNVLEHVKDLAQMHREIRRVLKPDGYAVHILPSSAWRFWTSCTTLVTLAGVALIYGWRALPRRLTRQEPYRIRQVLTELYWRAKTALTPTPHGERGNAITEIWLFSRAWWLENFRSNDLKVTQTTPMGLFYSGNMLFGRKLSFAARTLLARFLGSATTLFIVQPR